jgi:hypothetical protein
MENPARWDKVDGGYLWNGCTVKGEVRRIIPPNREGQTVVEADHQEFAHRIFAIFRCRGIEPLICLTGRYNLSASLGDLGNFRTFPRNLGLETFAAGS